MLRHLLMRGVGVGAMLVLLATGVPALEETSRQMGQQQMGQQRVGVMLESASQLLGKDVTNPQGQTIGTIKDIVLTPQRDQIAYVAFGHGGVLGAGQKVSPIPWSEFRLQRETTITGTREKGMPRTPIGEMFDFRRHESHLMLNVSSDVLDKIPGVEGNIWPDQAVSLTELQGMTKLPEHKMSDAEQKAFETRRISKLVGLEVKPEKPLMFTAVAYRGEAAPAHETVEGRSRTYDTVGELKDIVLNANNGRLIYGVVALNKIEGYKNESSIVPWSALQFPTTEGAKYCQLSVPDADTLLAYTFTEIQQRMLANRGFAHGIFGAYDRQPQWETLGFVSPEGETREHRSY